MMVGVGGYYADFYTFPGAGTTRNQALFVVAFEYEQIIAIAYGPGVHVTVSGYLFREGGEQLMGHMQQERIAAKDFSPQAK